MGLLDYLSHGFKIAVCDHRYSHRIQLNHNVRLQ
jgi:hypothetical protein